MIELPLRDTIDVFTASRMADVSPETVRRWCDEGRIPCVKLVGRWRIYRAEYLDWIKSSTVSPAAIGSPSPAPVRRCAALLSTKQPKPTKQLELPGFDQ
jgi:excisionase family DNA binding protein